MSSTLIRKMNVEDIDSVMQIWLETNLKAHSFIPARYWEKNFNTVKTILPETEIYVADQEGQIVGFIGLDNNYIAGIFICEYMQSQSIGKQLLYIAKNKYPTLQLHVYKENLRAVTFYKKQNFIIKQSRIDTNTGKEEFLMEWKK
ncbi:GNAT family N-acetyltransferase [Coprobacter sp.]